MDKQPIRSNKEARQVEKSLITEAMQIMSISKSQAKKRVRALMSSGILESGHPDDPTTQRRIDEFLATPV